MDTPLSYLRAKAHYAWRRRMNRHLPALARRVFALRDQEYMGCGFHYVLEANFGYVMARMNDCHNTLMFAGTVIEKLRTAMFLRDLVRAEFSARGHPFPYRYPGPNRRLILLNNC